MVRSLAELEAFYWVVRLGGFQAAATRLHVSQPTISNRVKELERRAGRLLLTRTGHHIQPTPHGATTFEYAQRIIGLVQDLEGRLRSGGPLRGVLRLGTSDGFAMICLGDVLKALRPLHPELRIAVTVGNSRALEQRLRDRELDLAILSDAQQAQDLRIQSLGEQAIAWVGSPHLDVAPAPAPHDLLTQQIFSNPPPSHLFSVLMDWFGGCGLMPPPLSICDSVAVILSLVTAGAGISILPVCIVQPALDAGVLRRLDTAPAPPRQRIVAAWAQGADAHGLPEIVGIIRGVISATRFLSYPDSKGQSWGARDRA